MSALARRPTLTPPLLAVRTSNKHAGLGVLCVCPHLHSLRRLHGLPHCGTGKVGGGQVWAEGRSGLDKRWAGAGMARLSSSPCPGTWSCVLSVPQPSLLGHRCSRLWSKFAEFVKARTQRVGLARPEDMMEVHL